MKKKVANRLVVGTMAALTGLCVIGTISGTLSWYAYSTRVYVSFVGTSVRKSVLLNIGIVDPYGYISAETVAANTFTRTTNDGKSTVWTTSSTGMTTEVINEYLAGAGYATNYLSPVSSHSRAIDANTDISLYRAPDYGETTITDLAGHDCYVEIPFAFKVVNNDYEVVADQEIWLTEAQCITSGGQHLEEAVRVFVNNQNQNKKFILSPSDSAVAVGYTKMGGLLDLDNSETYDYDVTNKREYIYGEYDVAPTPTWSDAQYGIDKELAPFVNVNETPYENKSTFYAKHDKSSKVLTNYGSVAYKTCGYETLGTVKPKYNNETGLYYADSTVTVDTPTGVGKPIAFTDSEDRIGYATIKIYLEGWDHSIVNAAIGCSFSLGLTFEINRVN